MIEVPISDKIMLTVDEAAAYSNIGQNRIRDMLKNKDCDFAFNVGTKTLIKRTAFEKYLLRKSVI